MNSPIILIHPGWQDSGPGHWQTLWLQKYKNAVKVEQHEWTRPMKEEWVKTLNTYNERYKEREILLVGHSLGCITISHWAAQYSRVSTAKILGALLVSPGDIESHLDVEELKNFAPLSLEPLPFKSIVVTSNNDFWVSSERGKYFAQRWGSQYIDIGPHGHISSADGFGEWPEGEKLLAGLHPT